MRVRSSRLVRMADEAARPSAWWLGWLVAIAIIVGGASVGSLIGKVVLGSPTETDPTYQYGELFSFGLTLLLLYLWVRFKERRPLRSVGFRPGRDWRLLPLGFLVGAAMMAVGVLLGLATGQYAAGGSTHTLSGGSALLALLPLLVVFVLQGSTEETVTRGYMLQIGGRQLPGWVAVLASSVIFAVVHLDFDPMILLNIGLYAVFASLVALRQGSLWMVCGIHAGWNFFQGNVFGLPVSGIPEATSLWTFGPARGSSELLSGGSFGLEAGLFGTVVLGAATIVAFVAFRRSADPVADDSSDTPTAVVPPPPL